MSTSFIANASAGLDLRSPAAGRPARCGGIDAAAMTVRRIAGERIVAVARARADCGADAVREVDLSHAA